MGSSLQQLWLLLSLFSVGISILPIHSSPPQLHTSFSFDHFSTTNLTLLGDGFIRDGTLGLTRKTPVPTTSVSRALYNLPVRMKTPPPASSSSSASFAFETSFSFSVENPSPGRAGDGLAFIIAPDNVTLGGTGRWLGLMNSTAYNKARTVAVEFDTFLDVSLLDINDNHIGIDIDTGNSIFSVDVGTAGIDLKSGNVITAWIDYKEREGFQVSLSYNGQKPDTPLLVYDLSLWNYMEEFMYVGFCASTEGGQELHTVYTWSFSSTVMTTSQPPPLGPSPAPPLALAPVPTPIAHSPPVPTPAAHSPLVPTPVAYSPLVPTPIAYSPPVPSPVATVPTPYVPVPTPAPALVPPSPSSERDGAPDFDWISPCSPPVSAKMAANCYGLLCMGLGAFLGLSTGAAIGLASFVLTVVWCIKGKVILLAQSELSTIDSTTLVGRPREFSYKELSVATNRFSSSEIVGHGAFGTVYKGILRDGSVVAIKRSLGGSCQSMAEFMVELNIIGRLRHRNLAQLLGWCSERGEILLVYNYMPLGSLDKILFTRTTDTTSTAVLPWAPRYKIVTGIASALVYLHHECDQQIVHRDVKPSNVLLDLNFEARLADFGLARLTDHDKSPESTLAAGTMGYLAPEYIHTGKATSKTDVFSFGAVALEVACGRRTLEKDLGPHENVLVDWVWGLHKGGRLIQASDPRLVVDLGPQEKEGMLLLLQVGLLCSHPDPFARPSMRQVVQFLTLEAPLPPLPPFKPTPSVALHSLPSLQDIVCDIGEGYYKPHLELDLEPRTSPTKT